MEYQRQYRTDNSGPDQVLPAISHRTSDPDGAVKLFKTESGPASLKPVSVYSFFKNIATNYPEKIALSVKRDGIWRDWTYKEYFSASCIAAKAMIKLGLERFHGVCIMGYNCPEWLIGNFGCIFAGGLSAGIYTTNSPEATLVVAENCNAQIVLVEDAVCLDKFLAIKRFLPDLKAIVQWSGEPGAPGVLSWSEFLAIGKHETDDQLNLRLSLAAVNQCCTLIYTSGTTGPPKGVMLSQDNITWISLQYKGIVVVEDGAVTCVSYLPLSHLAAQLLDMYLPIVGAHRVYFSQPDALKGTLVDTLKEVHPWGFFGVPRVWEKIYERFQEAAAQSGFVTKKIANWAKYNGLNYYKALMEGRELSSYEKWQYYLARNLVLQKVKEAIGFDKAVQFASGSAPISLDVLEYFFSLDMPIMEFYGMSENLSLASFSKCETNGFKIGSVGKTVPWTEICLIRNDEHRKGEGEICSKGRNICMGYLKMPQQTEETIDDDGWLHTGDLGWFDEEGFLFITGRLKELIITAGGENIPPVIIEDAIKSVLPCVSNAMLVGDGRNYLTILLTLKCEVDKDTNEPLEELSPTCISWLRINGSQASTVFEAIKEIESEPNGLLTKAINIGVQRYNSHLAISNAQKVQKWTILPHEFSLQTGELNNTLKLKRSFVLEKYADVIEKMYSDSFDRFKSKL